MPERVSDEAIDAQLAVIASCDRITLCSGEPVDLVDLAARALAQGSMVTGHGNGDYSIVDNLSAAGGGRRILVSAQAGVPQVAAGDGNHVALDDGTTVHLVTPCPNLTVSGVGSVDLQAFEYRVTDPS